MIRAAFYLFLLSATFGTRKLLYQFTGGFHEYEAVFVYASDIFLLFFLVATFYNQKKNKSKIQISNFKSNPKFKFPKLHVACFMSLVSFLVFSFLSIFFAPCKLLAFYQFARLVLLAFFAFAAGRLLRNRKVFRAALVIIAVVAVLQSLIGIAQFAWQENLGLKLFGESPISIADGKSSKIIVEGSRVLRAYGLFPHPNMLGAFLALGLLALIYFYLRSDKPLYADLFDYKKSLGANFRNFITSRHFYLRLLIAAGMFVVLTGLVLTFSRAAWLSTAVGFSLLSAMWLARERRIRPLLRLLIVLMAIGSWLLASLGWAIVPRATVSAGEPAVNLRLAYNKLAVDLIREHPFGVGIGNQVLYSVKSGAYREHGLTEVWQWQPVHNVYLLALVEIGWLGGVVFIAFLASIFFINPKFEERSTKQYQNSNVQNSKQFWSFRFRILDLFRISNFEFRISATMLLALLIFGFFDHFLWTIWQGQLMLWLAIGLMLAAREPGVSGIDEV